MKACISLLILTGLFQSCIEEKEDIITATIPQEKLQEDLSVLKNILCKVHAGIYVYNTREQIGFLFDSISHSINGPLTTAAFYNKVDCIVDRIRYVHSITMLPAAFYDSISVKKMFMPFPVVTINNRLYMNSNVYTIPLGSEIIAINNWSAQEIISTLSTYNHIDGFRNKKNYFINDDEFALDNYMAYGAANSFLIRYIPDSGQEKTINYSPEKLATINRDIYNDTYFFYPTDAPYDLELNDAKKTAILTVRIFHFGTAATQTAFTHFLKNSFTLIKQANIKNLVIDCRNNGGGYYAATYDLISYLIPENLPEYDSCIKRYDLLPYRQYITADDTAKIENEDTVSKIYTQIRSGVFAEKKEEITRWEPSKLLFKGKLFLIINGQVASAASTMASVLKDKTNVYIIGEESNGNYAAHNSGVFTYELPNSHLKIDVPTKRFYQPVKDKQTLTGVVPSRYIPLTAKDVMKNIDRPLAFILDSVIKN